MKFLVRGVKDASPEQVKKTKKELSGGVVVGSFGVAGAAIGTIVGLITGSIVFGAMSGGFWGSLFGCGYECIKLARETNKLTQEYNDFLEQESKSDKLFADQEPPCQ